MAVTLSVQSPLANAVINDNTPTFNVRVTSSYGNDVSATVVVHSVGFFFSWTDFKPSGTTFSLTVYSALALSDGQHRYRAWGKSTDDSGQEEHIEGPFRYFFVDTKAPTKPTCVATVNSETAIKVQWSAFNDPSPSSGFSNVTIFLEQFNGSTWAATTNRVFTTQTHETIFAELDAGGYYRARARYRDNASNYSAYSDYAYVQLNSIPTTPSLIAPVGGESFNALETISWTNGTDADGDMLSTEISLSTDNGGTWKVIATATNNAETYSYDFSSEATSNLCKIRIRHYDGKGYSDYAVSPAVFSIAHFIAPLAPTQLSPTSVIKDLTEVIRLSWKFNDQPGDSQSAFEIRWSDNDWVTENAITRTTGNNYFDVSANLFPEGTIRWKVKTKDQGGLESPFSDIALFTAAAPSNAPVITLPESTVNISRPTIVWTQADQAKYQAQVLSGLNDVIWDTGEVASTNKAIVCGIDLANGSSYIVKVRTQTALGLWTSWASLNITISFIPPEVPLLTVTVETTYIDIIIENPEGTTIKDNSLYRREKGTLDWTRLAVLLEGVSHQDYGAASGTVYEYRAITLGINETTAASEIHESTMIIERGAWLHSAANPAGTIYGTLEYEYNKSGQKQMETEIMRYEGRTRPAVQYGEMLTNTLDITLFITDENYNSEEFKKVEKLLLSGEVLCYRDERGRKVFGVAPNGFSLSDTFYGYELSFALLETSYKEGV